MLQQLLQLSIKNERIRDQYGSAHNSLDIFFRKTRFNGTHQRVVARDRGIPRVSLIIAIVN